MTKKSKEKFSYSVDFDIARTLTNSVRCHRDCSPASYVYEVSPTTKWHLQISLHSTVSPIQLKLSAQDETKKTKRAFNQQLLRAIIGTITNRTPSILTLSLNLSTLYMLWSIAFTQRRLDELKNQGKNLIT